MKQVVGGVFCGMHNERLEGDIIRELALASIECVDDSAESDRDSEAESDRDNEARRRDALRSILEKLKRLLESRLRIYLMTLVNQLFNPEVHLG